LLHQISNNNLSFKQSVPSSCPLVRKAIVFRLNQNAQMIITDYSIFALGSD